jgi:NADH-quinone oxidoreductase subunit N
MAAAMGVFMLALLGFPIFGGAGFFAKWYMIQAALQSPSPQIRLAVILVLTSVVSAGYYLYVVMVMFMRSRPDDRPPAVPVLPASRWVIATSAILILAIGLYPSPLARLARTSTPQPAVVQPSDTATAGAARAAAGAPAALARRTGTVLP